jgi:hypothetical protein
MLRRSLLVILTIGILVFSCTDLSACGDKFVRIGRSARFKGYASVHPSSILVYAPRWSRSGIAEFERILKRGGHKPHTVTSAAAMSQAFAGGRYDLVITSLPDAGLVAKELDALPSRPGLIPIVYKASKAEVSKVSASYQCVLKPETMTPFEALEEIDRLIDLRLKDTAAAATNR